MMLIFCLFLLGAFLIFHLFCFAIGWWKKHQQLRLIPGPTLLETLHFICKVNLCKQANCAKETKSFFTQNGAKYGEKYGLFWIPSLFHCIVVCNARLARQVLASETFGNMTAMHTLFGKIATGNGLLTCDYEQSKKAKQTFQSCFKISAIEQYIGQARKHLETFSLKVEKEFIFENDGHCADVQPLIANLTFDIIGETLFGVQFNAQQLPDEHPMTQQLHPLLGFPDRLVAQPWKFLSSNVFANLFFSLFDLRLFTETLPLVRPLLHHRFSVCQMICSRIKGSQTERINQAGESLLDKAIQSANLEQETAFPFGLRRLLEVQGHITTFLVTAQDSVSTTTSWLLFNLAHHPKVQSKVQQEIDAFLGKNSEPRNLFALNCLQYLNCCFLESLRLAPVAPYASRQNSKPFLLQTAGGSVIIPANISVIIDIENIHRQEEHFSQADEFIPERFLVHPKETSGSSEKASQPTANKEAFFPFGHGVRSCFGQRYGQMLVKLIIFNLLRQFTIRPVEGAVKPQPVNSIFQKAAHFPLHFARRTF